MNTLYKAQRFAREAHKGQKYGKHRYTYHLSKVCHEVEFFAFPRKLMVAAWLHDTLEDTKTTKKDLEKSFGKDITDLVWAVTDEPGKNRKERMQKTLPKIKKAGFFAIALKLCDRIANVKASIRGINPKKLAMYKKEYPVFRQYLYEPTMIPAMWKTLDDLLGFTYPVRPVPKTSIWLKRSDHTLHPTHLSHFYDLVSAYYPCKEEIDFLAKLIIEAQDKAKTSEESQIVDRDNLTHIFVVHPTGAVSLYACMGTFDVIHNLD